MPPSKSSFENAEISCSGKRERCNTGGGIRGDGGSVSMDLFDFLASDGAMIPLRSTDFVEDLILPEAAAVDAVSVKAELGTTGRPSTKLERNVTGDDIAPLNMSFRISSGNWIGDYEAKESANVLETKMHPAMFMGDARNAVEFEDIFTSSPPVSLIDCHGEYQTPLRSSGHQIAPMPSAAHWASQSLRRRTTRHDGENFCAWKSSECPASRNPRISSSDWVADFQDEPVSLEPLRPSLFTEFINVANANAPTPQPTTSLPPLTSPTNCDGEKHIPLTPSAPLSAPRSEVIPPLPNTEKSLRATSPAATQTNLPQSSAAMPENSRKKKHRTRQLDENVVVEPVENDVLCGRGGFTNNHPGNIRFREKALEFRPWYERSSKEEKQRIADLLVETVTSQGHRFLGKGKDGLWHEMVHGAHRKASQALRERIRRGSPGHGHA